MIVYHCILITVLYQMLYYVMLCYIEHWSYLTLSYFVTDIECHMTLTLHVVWTNK